MKKLTPYYSQNILYSMKQSKPNAMFTAKKIKKLIKLVPIKESSIIITSTIVCVA